MKKNIYILLLFVTLSLTSCFKSKDIEKSNTKDNTETTKISEVTQKLINVIESNDNLYDDGKYIQKYIDEGADVNAVFKYRTGNPSSGSISFKKFSPLTLASYLKSPTKMKVLLENGANPNYQVDITGDTPLTLLLVESENKENKVLEGVTYLIEADADPNLHKFRNNGADGISALHIACSYNYIETVKLLIKAGSNINYSNSDDGQSSSSFGSTALIIASELDDSSLLKVLLENGADPDIPTASHGLVKFASGSYPLHISVSFDKYENTKLLLEYGANPNVARANNSKTKVSSGSTPIGLSGRNLDILKLLLEYGSNPNTPRSDGTKITTLFSNSYDGNYDAVKILLNNNASINYITKYGTALDAAILGNQDKVITLLKSNGAKTAEQLGVKIEG